MNVYVQIGFSQYLEGCTSKIISALRRGAFKSSPLKLTINKCYLIINFLYMIFYIVSIFSVTFGVEVDINGYS
jgi:hypothetical protein